jgi:hypothetical protein
MSYLHYSFNNELFEANMPKEKFVHLNWKCDHKKKYNEKSV